MELKQGQYVKVEGQIAKIETWWGQGRHRMYKLDDGRLFMDLHIGVENGTVTFPTDLELKRLKMVPRVVPKPDFFNGEDHED